MKSSKAKALKRLLGIDTKREKVLSLSPNGVKKVGIISHTGNHRVEDKTTYSYVHGPKMRIYKGLKKAYNNKDSIMTSALLQYFFENREKIEAAEQELYDRVDTERAEELQEKLNLIEALEPKELEEVTKTFRDGLKQYYKADLVDLSIDQLGILIKQTQNKGENNE